MQETQIHEFRKLFFHEGSEEHISGGTPSEPGLTFSPLKYTDYGAYTCRPFNPAGSGTTDPVQLNVRCRSQVIFNYTTFSFASLPVLLPGYHILDKSTMKVWLFTKHFHEDDDDVIGVSFSASSTYFSMYEASCNKAMLLGCNSSVVLCTRSVCTVLCPGLC